jgi:hypothetical protein
MDDQEILARIAGSREKLRGELSQELDTLFRKEKEVWSERAQLFMSVGKWSAAAFAVIFGLLGIKAWGDVRSNVEEFFKTKLDNTYRLNDTTNPLAREIDQLINRAVVNALYVQVQRDRDTASVQARRRRPFADTEATLGPGELERLVSIAKAPTTESLAFEDTIYILNALVTSEDRRQAVSRTLAELLAAKPNSQAEWMASNEKKRLAILSSFRKAEAVDAVASELLAYPVSERLKEAVLARAAREDYKAAVPAILKFIEATDEARLKFYGLRALARLRPTHELVRALIVKLKDEAKEKNDLLHCLEIAEALAATNERGFFGDDEERQRRIRLLADLAIPIASKAFDGGVRLTFQEFTPPGIYAVVPIGPSSFRMSRLGKDLFSEDFTSLLLDTANKASTATLGKYLAAISLTSDMPSTKRYTRVIARLKSESRVQFEDGSEISSAGAKGGSLDLVSEPIERVEPITKLVRGSGGQKDTFKVLASWEDPSGARLQKRVKSMVNVDFGVSLRLEKEIDDALDCSGGC